MFKVLCIVQTVVPSTEISIIRPFTFLENEKLISWELIREASFNPDLLKQTDVIVFHRNCHPNNLVILNAVQNAAVPFIYEIDDNYFELPEELPIGRYMRNPRVIQTIESLLRFANIVKVGSPELIPIVSKYNQNIIFQPYAVDLSILNNITPISVNKFTIGYAGTIHHQPDFQFVTGPIWQIAKEHPQIHWDFIGCIPAEFNKLPNHTFTPFITSYPEFLQEIYRRNWQIGLCPVLDLPHNRCKTDNKLREYGACKIAGIYSNIPPYASNVQPGITGLLADNTQPAWYEALHSLINTEDLRNNIAMQACEWTKKERSIPVVANLWLELFKRALQ